MMLLIAFALGFIGYLPLGNINLTVVQLSISDTRKRWLTFIAFASIMEFIYCFGCLMALDFLLQQQELVKFLSWLGVVLFVILGVLALLYKETDSPVKTSDFKRGVLIAIFNPLQVPFWLVWGVYLMQNHILKSETVLIALFSLVCTIGTVLILYLYAIAGRKIVEKLRVNRIWLNRFIGALLIVLAILQTIKLLRT